MNLPLHRLEEISLNASPFLQQVIYDGWLLRFSEGQSKRANGVNVIAPSTLPLVDKIKQCEEWYEQKELPAVFRITTLTRDAELDATLERLGYEVSERVDTRWRPLQDVSHAIDTGVRTLAFDDWSQHFYALKRENTASRERHSRRMQPVAGHHYCYALFSQGRVVSCAQTVRELSANTTQQPRYVGLFNVFTDAEARGKGYATRLIEAVMSLERAAGGQTMYLQVAQQNVNAIRIYGQLGFDVAYEYWYRVKM
jgi:N-acetylglutamate synthase